MIIDRKSSIYEILGRDITVSMCKISVVATVYNKEKYIGEFLESIEKQRLQDIEVILVDDGSSDACAQILDDFARKDERYKVIHQPNRGVDRKSTRLNSSHMA